MYLNCHSHFSLRYGALAEDELLKMAEANGLPWLALTDINNTSAALNFIRLAQKSTVRPILGIDFRNDAPCLYVGLAMNNYGYQALNEFLSRHLHEATPLPEVAPPIPDAAIIYPFEQLEKTGKRLFAPHEYIGVNHKQLNRLRFSPYAKMTEKQVVLHPVSFAKNYHHGMHRLLRAMDKNILLSKLNPAEHAPHDEVMIAAEEMKRLFADAPHILANTEKLAAQCSIHFDFSENRKNQNLKTYTGSRDDDYNLLCQLSHDGLSNRYDRITEAVTSRLEKELNLIRQMDFVSFFLINWDIVRYAQSKGYYHVGRGSGANSIVAYLLGITDVDPIELDLYFERFMNLYRANPPDFDIDFSWRDREDVTRYIFEHFGKKGQCALVGAYSTFQHSAAVRELGKVFGLPKEEIDTLSDGKFDPKKLDNLSRLVLRYAGYLQDKPNLLTPHSAGVIISEQPITAFSATFLPPKGFPTVMFDMIIAEDVGLFKFDILGQRGLGKIKDTLLLLKKTRPELPDIDIHNARPFFTDEKVNEQVRQAQCIGCFYVESPAMRMLLKKLEVDNYLGLVAASSIIRPGVAKSGMMREYILRHKNPERRSAAHPILADLMPETYGVMVYQEDVIKVAHYFGGLTLGEADSLRRGMSGKFRSRAEFEAVKKQFFSNCKAKGHAEPFVQQVWAQIESFAGYAFAKGHSASYAVESYQSLYLKTYYPLEYMVAVLNNGGGFYKPEFYIHEARMKGGVIHPPHLNRSEWETTLEGNDIYLGFQHLAGLEAGTAEKILTHRSQYGPFQSLEDLLERVPLGLEQMDILIRIGAMAFTGEQKRALLWKAHFYLNKSKKDSHPKLFPPASKDFTLPDLTGNPLEDAFDQIELLGFPLCSPFQLLANPEISPLRAADFEKNIGKTTTIAAYLVTYKPTRTSKGQRMFFGTFTDAEGHFVDTTHFPPVAAKYPFRGSGVYDLTGKVADEFGFLSLEITAMEKRPYMEDPRYSYPKGTIMKGMSIGMLKK